jgi:glycosyltransferase involved in cell wall biosynthesis
MVEGRSSPSPEELSSIDRSAGTTPFRILHVVEAFGGGVLQVVRILAERLLAEGDTVAIAYGRRPESPSNPRACFSSEIELFGLWEGRTVRDEIAATKKLRALTRSWAPDVVHLHSSFAGVVGAVAIGRSVPSIYTPHGYSFTMQSQSVPRRGVFKAIERVTAHRVDLIGAVSMAEAEDARQVTDREKIVVVRNGIPELDRQRSGPPPDRGGSRPRVVAAGRIVEQRRPASAARILAAVSDVAEVSWIGGGGGGGVPKSTITDLGVPVTGWLDRAAALAALRSATAYLHWTAWDGQPLSILEAMASDVVVVASDIEAAREILGERQVCSTEAEAATLIRDVLRDRGLREDLLASQRERGSRFGARRMASEWRTVYEQIARTAPRSQAAGTGSALNTPDAMADNRPISL